MAASARAEGSRSDEWEGMGEAAGRLFAGPGEMRACCRALDWAATPLGPTDAWSPALRTAAGLVLASAFPMVLLWGDALVQLYKHGYRGLMGTKHPAGSGSRRGSAGPRCGT